MTGQQSAPTVAPTKRAGIRGWWRRRRVHECTPLTCDRARFWRDVALRAQADGDRYAAQIVRLGHIPEPLDDRGRAEDTGPLKPAPRWRAS